MSKEEGTWITQLFSPSFCNPAPVEFRCNKEDKGGVRRRKCEWKKYHIPMLRASTLFRKLLGTSSGTVAILF